MPFDPMIALVCVVAVVLIFAVSRFQASRNDKSE